MPVSTKAARPLVRRSTMSIGATANGHNLASTATARPTPPIASQPLRTRARPATVSSAVNRSTRAYTNGYAISGTPSSR